METEDVVINLQEDNKIILNCTYRVHSREEIADRYIRWQKQIEDTFEDLAIFSPPGGPAPFIAKGMENLYNNRAELIGPNTSLSAVMVIKDPLCADEGRYKCWIEFFVGKLRYDTAVFSVVVFNGIYIPST